jgi:hypothetical protein
LATEVLIEETHMWLSTIALIVTFALSMPIASVTSQAGQAALEAAAAAENRSRQKEDVV